MVLEFSSRCACGMSASIPPTTKARKDRLLPGSFLWVQSRLYGCIVGRKGKRTPEHESRKEFTDYLSFVLNCTCGFRAACCANVPKHIPQDCSSTFSQSSGFEFVQRKRAATSPRTKNA
jgi:hypothetical protein